MNYTFIQFKCLAKNDQLFKRELTGSYMYILSDMGSK